MDQIRIVYQSIDPYFFELCSNPLYYDKLLYYELVSNETIEKAKETVLNMSLYSNEIKSDRLLGIGYQVAGNLMNRVWIPKKFILDTVHYYANQLFLDYYMIGN